MKKFKLIQIISLLLCLILLACSCEKVGDKGTAVENPDISQAPVEAEAVRENFINFEYEAPATYEIKADLTELYGTYLQNSSTGNLLVFCKKTKDYMNNLTETYTVFSAKDAKVVKTFSNTYADENYEREDGITQDDVIPVRSMSVWASIVEGAGRNSADYITVLYTTGSAIDKETVEENELDYSYSVYHNVEFYDAQGNTIGSSKLTNKATLIEQKGDLLKASFGKTVAIFDIEENKVISTYDGDVNTQSIYRDYENENYYYYFSVPYGGVDYGRPIGYGGAIEVRNKADNSLVCQYIYNDYSQMATANALSNGDVLIQYMYYTEGNDYDIGNTVSKVDIQSFILDVPSGTVTEVEFNYMIAGMLSPDSFIELMEGDPNTKVTLVTPNIRNIAYAIKFENGTSGDSEIIFFDTNLTVNYVLDKDVYEQAVLGNVVSLEDGYTLVELQNGAATERAIIKDGAIVAYVPDGAEVNAGFIVHNNTIYDLTMEKVCEISPGYGDEIRTYKGAFGDYVVFEKYRVAMEFPEENTPESKDIVIYNAKNGYSEKIIGNAYIMDMTEDYLLVYDEDSQMFSLYNQDLYNAVITGSNMSVEECADSYIVTVQVNGEDRVFFFSANPVVSGS